MKWFSKQAEMSYAKLKQAIAIFQYREVIHCLKKKIFFDQLPQNGNLQIEAQVWCGQIQLEPGLQKTRICGFQNTRQKMVRQKNDKKQAIAQYLTIKDNT